MIAEVRLWGRTIGAVAGELGGVASFEYDRAFAASGIELSPLVMPLADRIYRFPELRAETFHGLPGLLADALPDRFGNKLIDAWLAGEGRRPDSFSAIERLCYTGVRGMGALEFAPAMGPRRQHAPAALHVDRLVALASKVLSAHEDLSAAFPRAADRHGLTDILRIGTSAGGARAKVVIAWNPKTNEVRSGQVPGQKGFEQWLLKLDGVSGNRDREGEDPTGYGAIEYAYSLMARAAGIEMTECRLMEEHGRRHFMTRRFDRSADGGKLHMQSLGALAHFDFNEPGAYAYEQAFHVIHRLGLGPDAVRQQFRRMLFNVVARNQDDHVKNIAFLMDRTGRWTLSPAFDVTFSYNPSGRWTNSHQMTINGKRDGFVASDFRACAKTAGLKRADADRTLADVIRVVRKWKTFAKQAKVDAPWTAAIASAHRFDF